MGYSGYSIAESDTAADLDIGIKTYVLEKLNNEFPIDYGRFNTPGYLNVAMLLTEEGGSGFELFRLERIGNETPFSDNYRKLVKDVLADMKSFLAEIDPTEWESNQEDQEEVKAYQHLIKQLEDITTCFPMPS